MKRFIVCSLSFVVIFITSNIFAYTEQTVLVYNFRNSSYTKKVAHYSRILPDNLEIELEKTQRYDVIRINKNLSSSTLSSLNKMRLLAEEYNSDFVIAGKYKANSYSLGATVYIYVLDTDDMYAVKIPGQKIGIFLNDIMDKLSIKVAFELQKHLPESYPPVISPNKARFGYYREITIQSGGDDAIIRYTTDGSYPDYENGKVYRKPFKVYKTTMVRAIAKSEQSAPSEVSSKKFMANFDVNLFELNFLYGITHFLPPDDKKMDALTNSQIVSTIAIFHLGGLEGVKPIPVIRNIGFGFWGDFASIPKTSGPINKMQGLSGGLFYKMRFHRHFMLQIPVTVGTMKTTTVKKDRKGFDGMFFGAEDNSISTTDNMYFNTGLMFAFPINDWFEIDLSATAKQINYSSGDQRFLSYQAGVGFGF